MEDTNWGIIGYGGIVSSAAQNDFLDSSRLAKAQASSSKVFAEKMRDSCPDLLEVEVLSGWL